MEPPLREPDLPGRRNSIPFVLGFSLPEALCLFPLGFAPDLLELSETGGGGPISWRSKPRCSWVDVSRAASVLPVSVCLGSHGGLLGLEWVELLPPGLLPPPPLQVGVPLFSSHRGQQWLMRSCPHGAVQGVSSAGAIS